MQRNCASMPCKCSCCRDLSRTRDIYAPVIVRLMRCCRRWSRRDEMSIADVKKSTAWSRQKIDKKETSIYIPQCGVLRDVLGLLCEFSWPYMRRSGCKRFFDVVWCETSCLLAGWSCDPEVRVRFSMLTWWISVKHPCVYREPFILWGSMNRLWC